MEISNKRILIVDDQNDLRDQLAKLLVNSSKKDETVSLVQSMRARLMGLNKTPPPSSGLPEEPAYDIDTAGSGQEAHEMVKAALDNRAPYAVIFTDMRMPPGWDGLKTAAKIREIDKNVEIVIMTAYADHSQREIAEVVGSPEKLLYIKKPFQAEEIFQLALSLTSKWNFEARERQHTEWLESLIKSMRKTSLSTCKPETVFQSVLSAILNFAGTDKGFLALWNAEKKGWEMKDFQNLELHKAMEFLQEHSQRLFECSTVQKNFTGKYLIPLRSSDFIALAVIYDAHTSNDPEWYKLLSLLVMTCSEVVSGIRLLQNPAGIMHKTSEELKVILKNLESMKQKFGHDPALNEICGKIALLLNSLRHC